MARQTRVLSLLLATFYTASCMEMTETVERMVVMRTTGSDLQPAATGFIYKRDSDGPAQVIKMEADEVMERLKKLPENYEKTHTFVAPLPIAAGPFYAKEHDTGKAASHASEAYVIPIVVEDTEDAKEDKVNEEVDGIANEDYGKIIAEFKSDDGDDYYLSDFRDYVHGLGNYGHHDDYHPYEHGDGSDYGTKHHSADGDKGHNGYASKHHYGKGGAGDYHTEKHASFSVSSASGDKKDFDEADTKGSDYTNGDNIKGDNEGHKKEHTKSEETGGYHKLFSKNDFQKDLDFDEGKAYEGGFDKFGLGHDYHGSDATGFEKGGAFEGGHDEGRTGESRNEEHESGDEQGDAHDAGSHKESHNYRHGGFGTQGAHSDGKGFGYEIKHR